MERPVHFRSEGGLRVKTEDGGALFDGVRMAFPAASDNVGFARTAAAVFASRLNFTLDELDEIKVAVSEAVSNCVLHAYRGGGWVRMDMRIVDGALHIVVEDDGVGIADLAKAREAGVTSRPDDCMGLGFTFMAEYMDGLDVHSAPGQGTRVVMWKRPDDDGGIPSSVGGTESMAAGGGERADGLVS